MKRSFGVARHLTRLVVYLGAKEVSDFVRRAFLRALNSKGRLAWLPPVTSELPVYEQRAEVMPLVDPTSIEIQYSKDDERQIKYQSDLFVEKFAHLTATVRSLTSYAELLAADADPFEWARDHAALRLAAIIYLSRRLDRAMPVLPAFAEQQFLANSADLLSVASLQDYLQFLRQQPLEGP